MGQNYVLHMVEKRHLPGQSAPGQLRVGALVELLTSNPELEGQKQAQWMNFRWTEFHTYWAQHRKFAQKHNQYMVIRFSRPPSLGQESCKLTFNFSTREGQLPFSQAPQEITELTLPEDLGLLSASEELLVMTASQVFSYLPMLSPTLAVKC